MASKRIPSRRYLTIALLGITVIIGAITINNPIITPNNLTRTEKTQAAEVNSIINPSFESAGSPIANWEIINNVQASLSQDSSTKTDGNVSAKITVTSAGSNADVQFYQTAPISVGKQYTIRFSAKASSARSIDFKMDKLGTSSNHFSQSVNLTSTWQQFSYTFTAAENDTTQRYEFNVGGATGQVWIDNATLTTIVNTPTPAPSSLKTTFIFTPTPSPTRSPIPSSTPSLTTTPTAFPTATIAPTVTTVPTATATPSPTRSPSPTNNSTQTPQSTSTSSPYTTPPYYYTPTPISNPATATADNFLIVSSTSISQTVQRAQTGNKVYADGFTITGNGATIWNIKYISAPSGVGFEPSSGIIKFGQTSTVKSYIQNSKPNGTYRGNAILEYFSDGKWNSGQSIQYALTITGSPQISFATATPKSSSKSTPAISLGGSQMITILNPLENQQYLAAKPMPIQWNLQSDKAPLTTAILLQKETGAIINTIANEINSKQGNNTYSWKIPQVLPGDYKLSITTARDLAATSDLFTIGSRLIIYAAGTPFNEIYPNMQLNINDRVVKTYFGVKGEYKERQFAQYYYYSPTKIQPDSIKITFTNDEFDNIYNDRNLILDRINIDGKNYETENPNTKFTPLSENNNCLAANLQTEWALCNGSFKF